MHRIAHLLGENQGTCETGYEQVVLMAWFQCSGCGEIAHKHRVADWIAEGKKSA